MAQVHKYRSPRRRGDQYLWIVSMTHQDTLLTQGILRVLRIFGISEQPRQWCQK